jgi:hypothetical protein
MTICKLPYEFSGSLGNNDNVEMGLPIEFLNRVTSSTVKTRMGQR